MLTAVSENNLPATVGDEVDVALIGAGVMSATLGVLLTELEPGWSQVIFERLDQPAEESSSPWNNAGTGHAALCELNYTPEANGVVNVDKALKINEQFQVSRQLWTNLVEDGVITDRARSSTPSTTPPSPRARSRWRSCAAASTR